MALHRGFDERHGVCRNRPDLLLARGARDVREGAEALVLDIRVIGRVAQGREDLIEDPHGAREGPVVERHRRICKEAEGVHLDAQLRLDAGAGVGAQGGGRDLRGEERSSLQGAAGERSSKEQAREETHVRLEGGKL